MKWRSYLFWVLCFYSPVLIKDPFRSVKNFFLISHVLKNRMADWMTAAMLSMVSPPVGWLQLNN
jgi:hypothetical protein